MTQISTDKLISFKRKRNYNFLTKSLRFLGCLRGLSAIVLCKINRQKKVVIYNHNSSMMLLTKLKEEC